MTRLALIALLALATLIPPRQAAAQDALGGAIFGGAAGAILGGALGGGRGAAVGAVLGATTGAAVASQGQPRPGGYYYYQNGCYLPQPDGSYVVVDPGLLRCSAAALCRANSTRRLRLRAARARRPSIRATARSSIATAIAGAASS